MSSSNMLCSDETYQNYVIPSLRADCQCKRSTADCGLRTADCRLQTADRRPGVKCRLQTKGEMQAGGKMQNEDRRLGL